MYIRIYSYFMYIRIYSYFMYIRIYWVLCLTCEKNEKENKFIFLFFFTQTGHPWFLFAPPFPRRGQPPSADSQPILTPSLSLHASRAGSTCRLSFRKPVRRCRFNHASSTAPPCRRVSPPAAAVDYWIC